MNKGQFRVLCLLRILLASPRRFQFAKQIMFPFFHRHAVFVTYLTMPEERVKSAVGETNIIVKRMVRLPINGEMVIESHHDPTFSYDIITVRLL